MRKKTIGLLVAVLTLSASFGVAPPEAAAQSDPLRKDAYTGSQNAEHMELRVNNVVVCKAYQTSRSSRPAATGCPTSGTARELLWNTNSDGSWYQVSKKTVTLGGGGGGGGGGDYTHTGAVNSEHMEVREGGTLVCSAYNTARFERAVATGCPSSGTFRVFHFVTNPDGTWDQIAVITRHGSDIIDRSGRSPHTGAQNAEHMLLRSGNTIFCRWFHTSADSPPAATGGCPSTGTYTEILYNTNDDGTLREVGRRTVKLGGGGGGGTGSYTATQNAAHMELRQNNVVVCKIYHTSSSSKPTASNCPTSGTFRELLWNTNSDGSWYQVSKKTVTIG